MACVNEGSHSFTCHPHIYPQVEWMAEEKMRPSQWGSVLSFNALILLVGWQKGYPVHKKICGSYLQRFSSGRSEGRKPSCWEPGNPDSPGRRPWNKGGIFNVCIMPCMDSLHYTLQTSRNKCIPAWQWLMKRHTLRLLLLLLVFKLHRSTS